LLKAALIIATDERALKKVFGTAVVRRVVLMIVQAGLKVHIVGHVRPLIPILSDLIPEKNFYEGETRDIFEKSVKELDLSSDEGVIIIQAHHIINRLCLKRLINTWKPSEKFYVMKSQKSASEKEIYLASPQQVLSLYSALWSSEGALKDNTNSNMHFIQGSAGLPYEMGTGFDEPKVAQSRLVSALAAQTEEDDGFLARHIDRPVSRFISQRLAQTKLTPNMITLTGASIGLLGAYFLSQPGYEAQVPGSLLFLFCVIVDGVDGEVARLTLKESVFGHYLDVITDNIVHAALFIALPLGLYHETGSELYLKALWFMLAGFALCLVAVYQCILRRSDKELSQSPGIVRFMALMTNRDFAYLIVILAIIGQLKWFVLGAAAGTYVFAFTLWIVYYWEMKK
jgi:phosphatidylglycerophosphate synthase